MTDEYGLQILGPGHVVLSRRPEDVQAARLEELRPAMEAFAAAYAGDRFWWALARRNRSRLVTRNKQRRNW